MPPRPPGSRHQLGFGTWLGTSDARAELDGLVVARTTPTVPAREVATHVHPEAHVIVVLSGHYHSSARGASGLVPPGSIIFNPAGTVHRDRFATLAGGRFLGLSVGPRRHRQLADAVRFSDGARLAPAGLAPLAARLEAALGAAGPGAHLALESAGLELLAALGQGAALRHPPPWLPRVEALLREGPEGLDTAALAREAGVHPVYLARVFRRFLRASPGEYLRRARLEQARAWLAAPGARLVEVALASGFTDQSHFTRCFRRAFGTTPARYRAGLHPYQTRRWKPGMKGA